jgi:hypothetical protein
VDSTSGIIQAVFVVVVVVVVMLAVMRKNFLRDLHTVKIG